MPTYVPLLIGIALILALVVWSHWYERRVTGERPPAGEMVPTPRGQVHLIQRGMEAGSGKPPIVLLHGSMTNALDMDVDLAGRLEQDRPVLIPDRPGHGYTDRPEDGWRLDVQAAMIRDAVAAAGVERPILLGQSYGGAVALRYALDFPDEVAGLLLVAPVTHPWPGGVTWYHRIGLNPLYGGLFRRSFIALYGRYGSPRGVARALRGSLVASRYHARTRVPMTFRPRSFHYNSQDIVRLYEQLYAMAPRYPRIDVPVEAVAGTHDMTVMTSVHSRTLEKEISHFRLKVVDGGGHALHHSHPGEVMEALDRLDARLASAARSPLQGALRRLTSVFPRSA